MARTIDDLTQTLPVLGQPPVRSDAAANRERILCAARGLLDARGAEGVSMNAVAEAAGVGKGTVFRRFGDRDGLFEALLNDGTAALQDGFLSGPPPLGPGAPAPQRLEAFVRALVAFQCAHIDLIAAARRFGSEAPPVYEVFLFHARILLEQIDPRLDAPVIADVILGAVEPQSLCRLIRAEHAGPERIADGLLTLLRGLTAS